MARALAAPLLIALGAVVVTGAQQRGFRPGAAPPCEAAGASASARAPIDLIESARCYDDRWAFVDAQRLLIASTVAIESQMAATPDAITASGPRFIGGDLAMPALTKQVAGEYPAA